MLVIFEANNSEASRLSEPLIARVRFEMGCLDDLGTQVRVQLFKEAGSPGGVDKRCDMELSRDGSSALVITSLACDWHTALDVALARANIALSRESRKQHKPVRCRSEQLALSS